MIQTDEEFANRPVGSNPSQIGSQRCDNNDHNKTYGDLFKKLFPVASCRNGIQDEKTTPRS